MALEHLNVRVGLVSQDGLKAMAVVVGEGQLRAGMRALAPDDHARAGRPRDEVDEVGDLGDLAVLTLAAIARKRRYPCVLGDLEDRGANPISQLVADRVAQPVLPAEPEQVVRRAAKSARTTISMRSICSAGICASASSMTAMWSAALLDPALPGLRIAANASLVSSQKAMSG